MGRRQIYDYPETGPFKTIIAQGCFDTLLTFPDGMIGQPHNKESDPLSDVNFD